jgi:hypothetical protein
MEHNEWPTVAIPESQPESPSDLFVAAIDYIESELKKSSSYAKRKVNGIGFEQFMAGEFFKLGLTHDEEKKILTMYGFIAPATAPEPPAPKRWEGYDHAQRAGGEYLDDD